MSLFTRARRGWTLNASDVIPGRDAGRSGPVAVTNDSALRHSAVWACLRLRGDLVSTMPVDVYRKVGGVQVEAPKPPVLTAPGGATCRALEWLYSSQVDLDRAGNTVGLITAVDGSGLPARIELVPIDRVSIRCQGSRVVKYRIDGTEYDPHLVWHERQYTIAGIPVGLSPVAYAAWSVGAYLSAQEFVLDWFQDGTIPAARLKNTAKKVDPDSAREIKNRFKAAVAARDLFVHGADWEYEMIQATASQPQFIEAMQYGVTDVSRFFGCPADLIDAASSGSSVTYANITQRNLQFLIMHLGPALARREDALSTLLPAPRFVKFNPDALLRMDPASRAAKIRTEIDSRTLTVTEARALENRPPLTPEQEAEFARLFGRTSTPSTSTTGVPA